MGGDQDDRARRSPPCRISARGASAREVPPSGALSARQARAKSSVRAGNTLALTGLSVFTLLSAIAVTALVIAALSLHLASAPEAGPWPVDFRPTLADLGVMTSGAYWAEGYLPTVEEISARISPLSEFASLGGPVKFGRISVVPRRSSGSLRQGDPSSAAPATSQCERCTHRVTRSPLGTRTRRPIPTSATVSPATSRRIRSRVIAAAAVVTAAGPPAGPWRITTNWADATSVTSPADWIRSPSSVRRCSSRGMCPLSARWLRRGATCESQ